MASEPNTYNANDSGNEPSLAEAVSALADALRPKAAEPTHSSFLKFIRGFAETVLPSAVMFALGYVFVQGVQLDLKQQEFTASSADKLKSYVQTIMTSTPENPDEMKALRATGLALGGFGGVAAYPLVAIIESGGEQRVATAKSGLEQAARIGPAVTCSILATVIDDATNAYSWQTQKVVAEVAGLAGCIETRRPLERLQQNIEAITDINSLTSEQTANFRRTIEDALSRTEAASVRRREWQ